MFYAVSGAVEEFRDFHLRFAFLFSVRQSLQPTPLLAVFSLLIGFLLFVEIA